jgi:hypothetical protein
MNKTTYISLAIGLLIGLTIGFAFRSCGEKEVQTEPIVIHDTITVQDSAWLAAHTKHNPKPIRYDTIWIEREDSADNAHTTTDSNHFVDTTKMVDTNADFALVPITQSEYRDTFLTDTSRAEVGVLFSGYNARIDSIGINYQLTYNNRVERKKSGFGWVVAPSIQVGYGLGLNGNIVTASPYVGIGVSIGWGYHW